MQRNYHKLDWTEAASCSEWISNGSAEKQHAWDGPLGVAIFLVAQILFKKKQTSKRYLLSRNPHVLFRLCFTEHHTTPSTKTKKRRCMVSCDGFNGAVLTSLLPNNVFIPHEWRGGCVTFRTVKSNKAESSGGLCLHNSHKRNKCPWSVLRSKSQMRFSQTQIPNKLTNLVYRKQRQGLILLNWYYLTNFQVRRLFKNLLVFNHNWCINSQAERGFATHEEDASYGKS